MRDVQISGASNATATKSREAAMGSPYEEVTNVLSDYFDGLYYSDASKLSGVFHPMAHYICATDGTFQYLRMDEYFVLVAGRPSPASRNESRRDRIISVEFAGPVTAFVRAECAIGPKFFTDFLTLVFIDGRWQIVSKVFHYDLSE